MGIPPPPAGDAKEGSLAAIKHPEFKPLLNTSEPQVPQLSTEDNNNANFIWLL